VPQSRSLTRLAPFFAFVAVIAAPAQTPSWRYDLRPGDHLIYRYDLHRASHSKDEETEVEVHFRTHVLVAGESGGHYSEGFQRNRESAQLSAFRENGKDKLVSQRVEFDKRMKTRPSHFSEAMEVTALGEPQFTWEMARESFSHLLPALHEIEVLPGHEPKPGEKWAGGSPLGFEFQADRTETIHGKSCFRVKGVTSDGSVTLHYWWSSESGVLEKIELEGSYPGLGSTYQETATLELESRARGETSASWLGSEDTRLGALQAILLSRWIPIDAEQLSKIVEAGDPASQSLALAIAFQRKLQLPAAAMDKVREPENPVGAILADRLVHPDAKPEKGSDCLPPSPPKPLQPKFGTIVRVVPAHGDMAATAYFVRIPPTYRHDHPSPVLVYLSGAQGFAVDGVDTAQDSVAPTDYIVVYPHAGEYWWLPEMAIRVDAVMHDLFEQFAVDRDRVYISGFSNGGTGALYMASMWPQRFAAVVSQMGAGVCIEPVKYGLPNLTNLPIFFLHGEKDPLIPPQCSITTESSLNDLHPAFKPELKVLPNRGHDISLLSDDGMTLAYFKDKRRNAFPRRLEMNYVDHFAARNYWMEVLDANPGVGHIEARIKDDNTIDIHSHDVKRLKLHLRPELLPRRGDVRIQWNGKKLFAGPLKDVCASIPSNFSGDPKLDLTDDRELILP
jgi:pimeloyl-ACP methyl ester carboxylesterase